MKTDARVRYTRMVIKNALVKLLRKKSIRQVTVKELCDIAEINRATFYSHYSDVYDLLDKIQESLYVEIESTLKNKDTSQFSEIIDEVLDAIRRHASLCQILFSENGDKLFLDKLHGVGLERVKTYWTINYPEASENQLNITYLYIISGSIKLIEYWVTNGLQESNETMARTIEGLNQHALKSLEK